MHKSARIQQGLLNHRIAAGILDTLMLFLISIMTYLLLLYTVFIFFGYVDMNKRIDEIENEFNLKLSEREEYTTYDAAIKEIYFNRYSSEIVKQYKDVYNKDYSITHIYNIVILRLPAEPTFDNYKTDFFQYNQKADGTFDVDSIATKIAGAGSNYERGINSLFNSEYKKMKKVVEEFNEEYFELNATTYSHECYSRMIAFILSFVVVFVIIPFKDEYNRTFFMKRFDLAYVNEKNGYRLRKNRIIIRNIICVIIPFIGYIIANKYSVVILILGYYLLDYLLLLFSKNNTNISDGILHIETCKFSESLIFDDSLDEDRYLQSEEGQKVSDETFVRMLENTEEIIAPKSE